MKPIIDAHLDLAINAVSFDRDLTGDLAEMNRREAPMTDHPCRGRAVLTLPEMRAGAVAVCLGTVLARVSASPRPAGGFRRTDFDHSFPGAAYGAAQGQRAYYELLEAAGEVALLRDARRLDAHWSRWEESSWTGRDAAGTLPVGIILSMEGCDPIAEPEHAELWWRQGLRVASLAHYGQGRYAAGTACDGPITATGFRLLSEFERLGMVLDVTHLSEESFSQALDAYAGPVLASHNNCRALVPGGRQFSDDQIRRLAARGGIIGVALDAWMLYPGWVKGATSPSVLSMDSVVDQIDHICRLTGDTLHAAVGSDLDGGYGNEQTPGDCRSITALQRTGPLLRARGYSDEDVDSILSGNWLRFFRKWLPAA